MQLGNHLGNVLTTITDKKFGVSSNGTTIDYFEPEMISGTDYYSFGSPMRGAGEGAYRFGFNGKENDNEVKGGEGLQQDYGMRVYDSRLGRFLSFDPFRIRCKEDIEAFQAGMQLWVEKVSSNEKGDLLDNEQAPSFQLF